MAKPRVITWSQEIGNVFTKSLLASCLPGTLSHSYFWCCKNFYKLPSSKGFQTYLWSFPHIGFRFACFAWLQPKSLQFLSQKYNLPVFSSKGRGKLFRLLPACNVFLTTPSTLTVLDVTCIKQSTRNREKMI